jgi:hypothetical protein
MKLSDFIKIEPTKTFANIQQYVLYFFSRAIYTDTIFYYLPDTRNTYGINISATT